MKSLIIKLVFLGAFATILLSSCKKQPIVYPTDQLPAHVPTLADFGGISRWGKFVLVASEKYVTNTTTGVKTKYDDFGSGSRSSLRWGGSQFDIETIIKDTTTWSFWKPVGYPGTGKFALNSDTTKFYLIQYNTDFTSIIEDPNHNQNNLGGSSRPFSGSTTNTHDSLVAIDVQTGYVTLNGDACEYFTELTFKKIQNW
jgi:hypothetical protein